MSELIISVSGLRGVVGDSLTPEVLVRYVGAFAARLGATEAGRPAGGVPPRVIVGRDGRASGRPLADLVTATLQAAGCEALSAGVVATPTIGILVVEKAAAGAIQITASHNPAAYNGIKLFGPDGRVLDALAGADVAAAYREGRTAWVAHDRAGGRQQVSDPHARHLDRVLATVDVTRIVARRYRVLLDSNHGAGGELGERLLRRLGCDVVTVGREPDGRYEHPPEPTAENLRELGARVLAEGCEVGFCQDPDADRLALVDAAGRYVGEECTLALCVRRALDNPSTRGPIVINLATSGVNERLATAAGVPLHRSAVGEANVVDRMLQVGAAYGGEGNGGPIDPRVGLVRDSFVGIAQVLDLMATTGRTLAELVAELPPLAMHKSKVTVADAPLPAILKAVAAACPDARADWGDGLRLVWPDSWLLVRGSNTEPIVRLIAEAATPALARELCQRAEDIAAAI
ncbi:MAG: phosphoglucosamine mutase [Planctomycetaceae bacterium]|nr:MAG: phosphoglucosamine mutase [Planctomycetaceae bacterium]